MSWSCFLVVPTDRLELGLRRYADGPCPAMEGEFSYHSALRPIGRLRRVVPRPGGSEKLPPPVERYANDVRWPKLCDRCHRYRFRKRDHWQVWTDRIWRPSIDDGRRFLLHAAPVGAMWDAWWIRWSNWTGPDGLALAVALPPEGGWDYWLIDGPSTSGAHWTRSGSPPAVTVNPSILTPRYHGWLHDGVLSDPL